MSPETTKIQLPGIDESESIAAGRVVRRMLGGGFDQDYFVYRPTRAEPDPPILVVIHDITRDPMEVMSALTAACDREGTVLVAPHFAADRYPDFQRLGRDRRSKKGGQTADGAVSAIIDDVAELLRLPSPKVHCFGYGAGGRFAIRYAMAHPDRVASVVSAFALTYTLPDPGRRFPRGLDATSSRSDLDFEPERFLRVPMAAIEARIDGGPAPLPTLRRVDDPTILETSRSGRNWVAAMRAAAEQRGIEPCVVFREVSNSADSFTEFVEDGGLLSLVFDAIHGRLAADGAEEANELSADESDGAEPQSHRVRRLALMAVIGIVLLAIATPIVLWVQYRATHVIARDAVVRGHISDIGAQLDGVVMSVLVDAGDLVKKGQVVARLQDRHLEAKVRHASSQLEKASRELEVEHLAIANERRRLEGMMREVSAGSSAAEAELQVAESLAEEALRRLELQRSLARHGLLAREQVRVAETEYRTESARAAAARAEGNAAAAARDLGEVESEGLAVREKRISVLESEIAALEAGLSLAQADLDGTIILAPDDGAVVRRIVEPGAATVVGQPIISLWVGEEIWVEAWIDESDLADLEVGSEATVTLNSYPDREFTGFIEMISVSTDYELPDSDVPQPRGERMRDAPVLAVRIKLHDVETELFPGLSAVVGIRKKSD